LKAHVATELARFKVPREVVFVDAIVWLVRLAIMAEAVANAPELPWQD